MLSVLAIGLFPEANIYLALNYLASYTQTIFLLSNHGSKNGACAKINDNISIRQSFFSSLIRTFLHVTIFGLCEESIFTVAVTIV